jgi:hypothetical protein
VGARVPPLGGWRRSSAALPVLAATAVLASCSILGVRGNGDGPDRGTAGGFPHAPHVWTRGMECRSCHETAAGQDAPGFPAGEKCMGCHEGPGASFQAGESIREVQRRSLAGATAFQATPPAGDLIFRHGEHGADRNWSFPSGQKKPLGCEDCHAWRAKATRFPGYRKRLMETCRECHASLEPRENPEPSPASPSCSLCHARTRADLKPETHAGTWPAEHGEGLDSVGHALVAGTCGRCHEAKSCVRCHRRRQGGIEIQFRLFDLDSELERVRASILRQDWEKVEDRVKETLRSLNEKYFK